jgi:hypothetical protein
MADADSTYTKGDTWPPQRFKLEDATGLIDWKALEGAGKIVVLIRSPTKGKISGNAVAIDPAVEANEGFNLEYKWAAEDLKEAGSDYDVEVKVYWDEDSSPPKIQTFPNKNPRPTFEVVESNE